MKQLLLLFAAAALACQPGKDVTNTPVVTVDTLIRVDTLHRTDTVSVTTSVHDTVFVPVHDTIVTRIVSHDTVVKMVTTVDSVPVHDTVRVTVAIHDTTFVPKHDTVVDSAALNKSQAALSLSQNALREEVKQFLSLDSVYNLLKANPVHDTVEKVIQQAPVHDTTIIRLPPVYVTDTVFRTDSILYDVITQARMEVLQHSIDSLKARPMGSAAPPYVNCVMAEGLYYQGGADSVIYVPVLGDPDRVAMWAAEHISGADQSYGPAIQVCMDNATFSKSKKALVASYGPGLSMQKVGADSEMVIQGLPGPSNSLRLMLFSRGTLLKMVYGIPGHPTSEWAQGLDLLLNKPSPEQK